MLHNTRLSGCQCNTTATALHLKHNYYCKPKVPRVGSPLELFVRAIQTENSLGNEALSLHSMKNILANKTFCNQTTEPKTPIQSRI